MDDASRPPLVQLGNQEQFNLYERHFNRLYLSRRIVDVLGNVVTFPRSACWHVCFTPEQGNRRKGKRDVWAQERAERIAWIEAALCSPKTEVRPNNRFPDTRLNYLLVMDADPEQKLEQEYFCVVVDIMEDGRVEFITAYPINRMTYVEYRKAGKKLYPVPKNAEKEPR